MTIGAEGHAANRTFVVLQRRAQWFKAGDIPHPNSIVLTARDQNFSVRAEGQAVHALGMATQWWAQRFLRF